MHERRNDRAGELPIARLVWVLMAHPWRRVWLPFASVGAVFLVVAAWFAATAALPLAVSAPDTAAEFRKLSNEQFGGLDPQGLSGLESSLDAVAAHVRPIVAPARWTARLSPALAWAPGLDREVRAWAVQAERLDTDLKIASALLSASSELLDSYREAEEVLLSVRSSGSVAGLRFQAGKLEDAFEGAARLLAPASRHEKNAPAVYLPRVGKALAALGDAEAQMRTTATMGGQASALLMDLVGIGERVQPLLGQFVVDGEAAEPLAFDALGPTLEGVDGMVRSALDRSGALAVLASESGQGEEFLGTLEVMDVALGALRSVSAATLAGLQVVEPLVAGDRDGVGGIFGGEGAMVAAFTRAASQVEELSEAVALLEEARRSLEDIESRGGFSGRTRGLGQLAGIVDLLEQSLRLVIDIAPIGGDLVGADGMRRYLVLGQSADELRATGGFVSALWLVSLENGSLVDVRYHDAVRVDDWDRLELYPPAPEGLEEHMNASVWLLRDVSWEPDFPTVARTAADMYRIGQRQEVDGVVAINQWALHAILRGLGSVEDPGGGAPITQRNLFSKLEEGSDQHGRAYVDLALQGILERLSEPLSLANLMKVASAILESLDKKDLLLFMEDSDVQDVLDSSGWDGGLRNEGADYLYIVDSNVGWSKADRNIQRQVRYEVDMRRETGARASLTLSYNNHSGPGSPGCEPQWINRGTNYTQLKNACYWDFWRVYTPQGTRLLGNTPLSLPEYSVSVEIGMGLPGEDTVKVSSSYNKTVLSGLFALGAGDANEINLVYDLPSRVITRSGKSIEYELLVQKQPGSRGRELTVELIVPEGYELASSTLMPAFTDESRVGFRFNVDRDTVLGAVFIKGDDGSDR